jgi:hypothetical protein
LDLKGGRLMWRKLHNVLHSLHSSPNIVKVNKSVRMRWVEYVARTMDGRGVYRVLAGMSEGKIPLGRHRNMWENNIKMDLRR